MKIFTSPIDYATSLVESHTNIEYYDFFVEIHNRFHSDQDISFMKYFLELTFHPNEFIVPHSKLVEFGIMTSLESSKVREKIKTLKLVINKDYTVEERDIQYDSGIKREKVYTFTPMAFKILLMKARSLSTQKTKSEVYIRYYLLLEEVFALYHLYRTNYLEKINSDSACKINILSDKIDKQSDMLSEQKGMISEQKSMITEQKDMLKIQAKRMEKLLGHAEDATEERDILREEVKIVGDTVKEAMQHLDEKSEVSTIKPTRRSLVHACCISVKTEGDIKTIYICSGQYKHVDTKHLQWIDEKYDIIVEPQDIANGVDLRQNCKSAIVKYLTSNHYTIDDVFEKLGTIKMKYKTNPIVPFDTIVQIIKQMIIDTKANPMKPV